MEPIDPDTLQQLPKSSGSLQVVISAASSSQFNFGVPSISMPKSFACLM